MDDVVRAYYDDYKNVMISLLRPTGMWPSESRRSIILDTIRPALAIFLIFIIMLGIVYFTVYNYRNIILCVIGCRTFINFGSSWAKMVTMIVMRRELGILNGGLTAMFESDLEVPENRTYLLSHYRTFYHLYKAYVYMGVAAVAIAFGIPLRAVLSGHFITVHAIRVPFDYTPGGALYYVIIAYEIFTTIIITMNTIGTDSVFGLYALQMVGELRLLSHRLRKLRPGENYRRELKDCIDRYNLLIRCKYLINRVFGFLCVWLALSCAIGVCSMIFQITRSSHTTMFQKFLIVDMIAMKFTQSYTYAWFGNAITIESEKCMESIYHSEWPVSADLRFRKDVNIIQLQCPIQISGMGIMIVRLDMFINIARASISYFFILKTLEEKFV